MNPRLDMEAKKHRSRLLFFLGLSALVHFIVMVGLYFSRIEPDPLEGKQTVFIDLNAPLPMQTDQDVAQDSSNQAKQIVESEAAPDAAKPKDPKYLGERDQAVEEEMKARQVDIFRKGGNPSRAGGGKPLALKSLAPQQQFTPPSQAEIDGFRQQQKQQQALAQGGPGSSGEQSQDNPGSASNDYLKDVKEGDRTMLSTKEFVYFGYYRRIRERLEVAWNSRLRSTLDSYVYGGRRLAQDQNYVTGLLIVLDSDGKIIAVQVLQKSGARDLDQAAIDAFNQAGPFPNPPSGLVDERGEIKIRWDFILQS